jgi:hypothetical protein
MDCRHKSGNGEMKNASSRRVRALASSSPTQVGEGYRALARWKRRRTQQFSCDDNEAAPQRPPPPCFARFPSPAFAGRITEIRSRGAMRARGLQTTKRILSPLARKRGSERREAHPTNVRATPADVAACQCAGRISAPKVGARSPSGAPLRHLPRLLPLGSAPGRASWNYRVQTGGPSPAPVQRAPRGPVVVPAGTMPEAARVRGYEPRPREPLLAPPSVRHQ